MSAPVSSDPLSKSAAKKKRKNKKKANGKAQEATTNGQSNGVKDEHEEDHEEDEDDEEAAETPKRAPALKRVGSEDTLHMPSSPPEPSSPVERDDLATEHGETPTRNGAEKATLGSASDAGGVASKADDDTVAEEPVADSDKPTSDTSARLRAMQQEREELRNEVSQLRQSLESLQHQHEGDLSKLGQDLEQTQQGKEHAETQYRNLLGKVNTIRSQLGERLKADAEELEQTRGRIDELETLNSTVKEENERLQNEVSTLSARTQEHGSESEVLRKRSADQHAELETLRTRTKEQNAEIESLRSRTNLSTNNWAEERDDMVSKEAYIREEYEVARQAMQDWEILATEERARREALEERIGDLEDQLAGQQEAYERTRGEAETQNSTVDGLQRALQEVQTERKKELRELVEQSQSQLEELRRVAKGAEDSAAQLKEQLESTRKELDRTLPFEKEVKEKNLLIGKLRHEAVILNDHLTKALRFLKRGKPEDNVDRQLVTNHFLHFLALDRSDPKKFQILQLIAALLGWTEAQREQAGLLRAGSGGAGSFMKLPTSPFRRSPSTPSLSADFVPESPGGAGRESLAELWSEFLEREAETGTAGVGSSRRGSLAKAMRSPSSTSMPGPSSPLGRESPELKRAEGEGAGSVRGGSIR